VFFGVVLGGDVRSDPFWGAFVSAAVTHYNL
jgi:hypothetical protein